MSTTIEINQDISDVNYLLLGKKALELWEYMKQQENMCNECERSDFTSDLLSKKKTPIEYKPSIPEPLPKPRGYWFEGIWMELEDGETVEDSLNEIRESVKAERYMESMERIEKREEGDYKRELKYWKERGWKYEDQPVNPLTGELEYPEWRCREEREKCAYRYSCDSYPDNCYEKEDFEKCGKYQPQFS